MRRKNCQLESEDRQLCDLLAALHQLDTSSALDLAERLNRCRAARLERRGDVTSALRWPFRCRSVACRACCRSRVNRKADRMADAFQRADNEDCSLLTVCLSRTSDLEAISGLVKDVRKTIRNLRDRLAGRDKRWDSLTIQGAVEVDAVDSMDLMLLPPERRALVPTLPLIGDANGYIWWLPHLHASVHHPKIDRAELRASFVEQFPGLQRVDVKAFYTDFWQVPEGCSEAEVNAFHTSRYALAQSCETTMDDPMDKGVAIHVPWPIAWQAHYFAWLHSVGRSLQALQVVMNPRGMRASNTPMSCSTYSVEPMPIAF
jgi:hypothetical protein